MTSSNSNEAKKGDRRPHRGWMITINNPKIPCDAYLAQWLSDGNIVYGCGQLEKAPATGTLHHQMYVVTKANPSNKNGFSLKWMKENIHSTAHYEGRRGTHEEATLYCTSEMYKGVEKGRQDGPWIVGEWSDVAGPVKGGEVNGSKILAVKRKIDDGAHDAALYTDHFGEMLRYGKAFERYRVAMKSKHRMWQTKALALFGPPGTGKSKAAWDLALATFGADDVYPLTLEGGDTVWWDGYSGQKCVVIEEFYGQMKIAYLLKLLDRYPLLVQTKGGMTPFCAEMVIFTSNEHPKMWYGKGAEPGLPSKIPLDILRALDRRFATTLGAIKEYKDVFTGPSADRNFSDVIDEMFAFAAQTEADQAAAEQFTDAHVVDLTSEDSNHDDEWQYKTCHRCENLAMDCICGDSDAIHRESLSNPTSPSHKVRRTDGGLCDHMGFAMCDNCSISIDQARWLLSTPRTSSGQFKPTGPGKVQAHLGVAKPSGAQHDDDDDVDDKRH